MQLRSPQPPAALYHETSDNFFERDAGAAIVRPVNLAFIDGLHLFEYAFRDFVNLERRAASSGLIVLDDIFPNHPDQGSRHRHTRVWTGDVWRLLICLAEQRPDLIILPLDCAPTGLLLVAGLDPSSRILGDGYNEIVRRYLFELPLDPPPALIARSGALDPSDPLVGELLKGLRRLADQNARAAAVRSWADRARPSLPLSVHSVIVRQSSRGERSWLFRPLDRGNRLQHATRDPADNPEPLSLHAGWRGAWRLRSPDHGQRLDAPVRRDAVHGDGRRSPR